ncbi:MAG: M23 family metallopeptidase, partial [Tepidiformaceae bacterium]
MGRTRFNFALRPLTWAMARARRTGGAVATTALRPFAQPSAVIGALAGAAGLGLGFLALVPEAHGSWGDLGLESSLEPHVAEVPDDFVRVERAYGYDRLLIEVEDAAPEGGIAEADVPVETQASAPAQKARFVMPLTAWRHVTDRYGAYRGPGWVHGGIDLDVYGYSRSPIYSSCEGTVAKTGYSASYGYHVIVDCGEEWSTLYGHMSAIYVTVGQAVTGGESVLGTTGNTGFSTGEHLHFEIMYQGARVNPERYLDFKIAPGTPLSSGPLVWSTRKTTTAGSADVAATTESDPGKTGTPAPTGTPTPPPTNTPTPP